VFEGDGAVLALTCDGFFGLRLEQGKKPRQDITGMWRLSGDGIELTLFNLQDGEIHATVGETAIHATLGGEIQASLLPVQAQSATFRATGLLERENGKETFTDAASGRIFPVKAPEAASGKFATVEMVIGPRGAAAGKILSHSGQVPRFFTRQPSETGMDAFRKSVAGRYWLLPPLPDVPKAALRLAPPENRLNGHSGGDFEISGPGLRFEGAYVLEDNKLTLNASRDSVLNTKLVGAGALLEAIKGILVWRISPLGLELSGGRKLLLLPSGS